MADPTASMWEVTQLILGAPGADASEIANAHGFSPAEVADLLPLFFDNLQADYSESPVLASLAPPEQAPGEGADEFASRYLGELATRLPGEAEVVSYDSFDAPELDPAGWDPSFDDVPHVGGPISGDLVADLVPDVPDVPDAPDADTFFGSGDRPGDVHEPSVADDLGPEHGGLPDVDDPPYLHGDQGLDDLAGPATDTDGPVGTDSHADTDSHPHTDAGAGHPDPDLSDGAFEF